MCGYLKSGRTAQLQKWSYCSEMCKIVEVNAADNWFPLMADHHDGDEPESSDRLKMCINCLTIVSIKGGVGKFEKLARDTLFVIFHGMLLTSR